MSGLYAPDGSYNVTQVAGTAILGKVGIDQTTPGTTDSVTVSTAQGAGAAIGATSGAAVVTDANGTIQQYLRGLVKLWIAGLAAGSAIIGKVGIDQTSGQNLVKQVRSTTATQSTVAGSASSVTILASNASRLGASVHNDSTAILYLLLGSATATTSVYTVKMQPEAHYEVPAFYTGQLTGIWASATGNARVTELT